MFTLWQIVGSRSHGPLSYTIYLLKLVALHGKLARITTEYYHRDIVIYFYMRIQNIPMKYPLYIIIYIYVYIYNYIYLYHCIIIYPHVVSHYIPIDGKSTSISKKSDHSPDRAHIGLPTTRRRCTDAFGRRRHPTSARCAA